MSLRIRIALAAATAVAAVAVGLGTIGYLVNRTKLINQIHTQLRERASLLISSNRDGGGGGGHGHDGPDGAGAGCGSTGDLHLTSPELGGAPGYFQTVCPDGSVAAERNGTELPVTAQVLRVARATQGSFFFTASVTGVRVEILTIADPHDEGALEVALPLAGVESTLRSLLATYLILAAAGAVLAGAAGLLIGQAAVAPIRRFSEKTEAVTSTLDRPHRLEETGAHELKRLAASFNQTLQALERSVESQRQLIADASHELRTPVASLRSDIQVFLEGERLPPEERVALQAGIVAELDDLTQLVADVLELARGTGSGDHVEPVELDGVVGDAIERTRRRAPDLRFAIDVQPTVILNHPDRVARAVLNVIDNARKWSPPGGLIEVQLRDGTLTVRDHGPGFEQSDMSHLFDRFYRSPRARGMPGSGLGLAIVRQAAEAHGGFAEARNAPGGGAVVRVAFHRAAPASHATLTSVSRPAHNPPSR